MKSNENVPRRDFLMLAAGTTLLATAALAGCTNGTPNVAPSSPVHEALTGNDKEAIRLMYEQEQQVRTWAKELLQPVLTERVQLSSEDVVRNANTSYLRRSKDTSKSAHADGVGATFIILDDTSKKDINKNDESNDDISITLTIGAANGEPGNWRMNQVLQAVWHVDHDSELEGLITGVNSSYGAIIDYINKAVDERDRDVPASSSNGLSLIAVQASTANMSEDLAAGYSSVYENIGYDQDGLYAREDMYGANDYKSDIEYSKLTPVKFNGLVGQFASHKQYAQKAVAAAIG